MKVKSHWTGARGSLGVKTGQRPAIIGSARTPIGRAFKGSLKDERPDDMVAQVIGQALQTTSGIDEEGLIDEVLVGCGSPAGVMGFNIAKVATNLLGLDEVPGVTVNRYCASSVETTRQAANAIAAGEARFVVSAGVESCTSYTHSDADGIPNTTNPFFESAREKTLQRERAGELSDPWKDPRSLGLVPDPYISMGQTAENVADLYDVSRQAQDEYALLSQQRTEAAILREFWSHDITPYQKSDGAVVRADDSPRSNSTIDGLAALSPVFRDNGTVTAGNSCPLSDGAAALILGGEEEALAFGIKPLARVISTAATGVSPEVMGIGPVTAVQKALSQAGLKLSDIDFIELNEAFAAQVIACQRELNIDIEKLNVNGGAISIGHPFGSTGARITHSLINTLRERDATLGLVTMCVGGGQGMAMIIERL